MKDSITYTFEVKEITPKVTRSFEDIKMLRDLLLKEFPGLSLPPLPAKEKSEVRKFFQNVWQIQDITSSDLFYQFLQQESPAKLFSSYRHLHEAYQTRSSLLSLLWSDRSAFSNELFKDIIVRNKESKEIERMPWGNLSSFNDYCENQYQCIQGSMGLIGHLLSESVRLANKVKENIAQLEPIFAKLKMQFERLNYAKQIFPAFDRSPVQMHLVWEKMSLASSALGMFTSLFAGSENRGD